MHLSGWKGEHPRIEVATLLQFLSVAAGRKTVPQDPNGIGGTIHPNDMTITLELLRIGGTATLTHYLVSFCQTVLHQRLGHRRLGGKLFETTFDGTTSTTLGTTWSRRST